MNASTPAATHRDCANCGTPAAGAYCHACGQRIEIHRLTLPHLLHEIPHAVFHVDRGILVTIRELALRPGRTINGYLDGRRIRYFNPLSLLMILAGLCALIYARYPFDYSAFAGGIPSDRVDDVIRIQKSMLVNYSLGLAAQLPFLSLASRLLMGGGRGYGEHLVINAFILAFLCVINLALMPIYMLANGTALMPKVMLWSSLLYCVYQIYALTDTFRTPGRLWSPLLRAMVTIIGFYALVMILAVLVGVIYALATGVKH